VKEQQQKSGLSLRERIDFRLDTLQSWMESNFHLENPSQAYALTLSISKFWSALSEEDREYVQCAQDAIEEGREWNV
jgi:hypothetical protein